MKEIAAEIITEIGKLKTKKDHLLIAIDGRCGSGKSTLGAYLQQKMHGNLLHMDDFYLRPEQRTPMRREEPGGNVDRERFLEEVLLPLHKGTKFTYRPFNCRKWELDLPVEVEVREINIVEGSYSCHPELCDYYDLHVFLTVDPEEQMYRIQNRLGKMTCAETFRTKWIPMEEKYFSKMQVRERCEFCFDTTHAERVDGQQEER